MSEQRGPETPRARDLDRFEASVLPHLDDAYNLARHLLRDAHEAEDAVQEACLRAMRGIGGFRGGDGRPWLLAIVRNTCFSRMRERRRDADRVEFDDTAHAHEGALPGPEAEFRRTRAIESVDEALGELPAEYREVIVLRELEGLAYKEIADVVGAPIGTVMSRLARARRRLAAWFGVSTGEGA